MAAEEIFDQLVEVALLIQTDMERSLTALGLTPTKTHLLWEVHQNGPCLQQRLAEALRVSARHVTALVDALEADGFARRVPHPHDRRGSLVELTTKGTATLTEMQRHRSRDAATLTRDLDLQAVHRLREDLDTVLIRLRQLVADAAGTDERSER